ncbi:MAG: cyclase family protein, partial [Nitrospinota bacterium]
VYPGHVKTVMWTHPSHEEVRILKGTGFSYEARGLILSDHGPTHVDALNHISTAPDARAIIDFPPEDFLTPGVCLDVTARLLEKYIRRQDLEEALRRHKLEVRGGDTVLLWTANYERHYGRNGNRDWLYRYPGLDREGTEFLADAGVLNIGVDAPSIDNWQDPTYPAHSVCRDRSLLNTENLCNLGWVAGRRFIYCGMPLRIVDGTGSPIRALALFSGALGYPYQG